MPGRIESKIYIYILRHQRVMLGSDLAGLYEALPTN
jgi:hypothetical protein